MTTQSTNHKPEQEPKIFPNRVKPKTKIKHDACHNFAVYTFCHCRCTRCWDNAASRCICMECNCGPRYV